jgi:uncharacterized protein YacL
MDWFNETAIVIAAVLYSGLIIGLLEIATFRLNSPVDKRSSAFLIAGLTILLSVILLLSGISAAFEKKEYKVLVISLLTLVPNGVIVSVALFRKAGIK